MSITETEIIKTLVLSNNLSSGKIDLKSQMKSIKSGNASQRNPLQQKSLLNKDIAPTQQFQAIQVQWNTYLRELRQQVIGAIQSMYDNGMKEGVFDSKIVGKFLISTEDRKINLMTNGSLLSKIAGDGDEIDKKNGGLANDSHLSQICHFDFSKVQQKLGADEKQICDNLGHFLQVAVYLVGKNPQKRLILDLRVGKLQYKPSKESGSGGRSLTFSQDTQLFELAHLSVQQEYIDQVLPGNDPRNEEAGDSSRASENLTRSNLNSQFGNFKRNPLDVLSLRQSLHTNYRKRKIIDHLFNKTSINQIDLSQFRHLQTPKSTSELQDGQPIVHLNRRRMKAQIDAKRTEQQNFNQTQPIYGGRRSVELGRTSPQMHQATTAASTFNAAIARQNEQQSARSQTSYMHKRTSSQGRFNRQSVVVVKSPENLVDFNQTMPSGSLFAKLTAPEADFPSSGEIDLKSESQNMMKLLQKVQKKNKQAQLEAVPFSPERPGSKNAAAAMSPESRRGSIVDYASIPKAPSSVSQKHRPKIEMGGQVLSSGSKRPLVSQGSNRSSPKVLNLTARNNVDETSDYVQLGSANRDKKRFELQINKIKENHNKAFDKQSLANNMGALLSHTFLSQKNSTSKNSHKQVPWHLRRNPISGMQYTQNLRSCSNNDLTFSLQKTPKQMDNGKLKFSFNKFVLQSQPEAWAYPTDKNLRDRHNSMMVVENALAKYKEKLTDNKKREEGDIRQHYQDIQNSNLLHKAQTATVKAQNKYNQAFLENQMEQERFRKHMGVMEAKENLQTCFVSHDFENKYRNELGNRMAKQRDHLETQEVFKSDKKLRNDQEKAERTMHERLQKEANIQLQMEEQHAETMRRKALQEMHKNIWKQQQNIATEKNRLQVQGYFE